MPRYHHRPVARIALRLIGIALLASLEPQGKALRMMIRQSDRITPAQGLLAAICFACASLGAMLLFWGPALWQPVSVARRWQDHAVEDGGGGREKVVPDG
ncbi:hypothetical protein ASE85_05125 [Sphingobium sp. Leaf26]|uniref:hypothetical protein n=1 Tax=Sphingobium sp. Leaf26 TaxID=1735693 RepID=UPI0006FE25FF|nr:hypothetical protein [Sphingobium sp. Leaf26]KQN04426.1 hypothetical protein ASE85_05125 [Sphingobium sp. Leaf26]